jgi:hypothetical protein
MPQAQLCIRDAGMSHAFVETVRPQGFQQSSFPHLGNIINLPLRSIEQMSYSPAKYPGIFLLPVATLQASQASVLKLNDPRLKGKGRSALFGGSETPSSHCAQKRQGPLYHLLKPARTLPLVFLQ